MKEDLFLIAELKNGENYIISLGEESGAEIWKINSIFILFEIPMYGGNPVYSDTYPLYRLEEMVKKVYSWT